MVNLAGNVENELARKKADHVVVYELTAARCTVVEHAAPLKGEVPTRFSGTLGPFILTRAWRYWFVKGPMPIALARRIYADPVAPEIRVAGHCGAPPPDEWAEHYAVDGRKILKTSDRSSCEPYRDAPGLLGDVSRKILVGSVFSDNPAADAAVSVVSAYHVDSALALRVWADYVRSWPLPWPEVKAEE